MLLELLLYQTYYCMFYYYPNYVSIATQIIIQTTYLQFGQLQLYSGIYTIYEYKAVPTFIL